MKRRTVLPIAILLAFLGPSGAAADGVLLIKSRSSGPYELAEKGFSGSYRGALSVVSLDKASADPAANPDTIVVLGREAVRAALSYPAPIPVVALLTFGLTAEDLKGRRGAIIEPAVPVENALAVLEENFAHLESAGLMTSDPALLALLRGRVGRVGIHVEEINQVEQVPARLPGLLARASCLLLLPDAKVTTKDTVDFILLKSLEAGKPVFAFNESVVRQGAFMGMVVSYEDMGAQAGRIASRGPSSFSARIQVLPPEPVVYVVNETTGRRLGLAIPAGLEGRVRTTP